MVLYDPTLPGGGPEAEMFRTFNRARIFRERMANFNRRVVNPLQPESYYKKTPEEQKAGQIARAKYFQQQRSTVPAKTLARFAREWGTQPYRKHQLAQGLFPVPTVTYGKPYGYPGYMSDYDVNVLGTSSLEWKSKMSPRRQQALIRRQKYENIRPGGYMASGLGRVAAGTFGLDRR